MNYRITYEKDKQPKTKRKNQRVVTESVVSVDGKVLKFTCLSLPLLLYLISRFGGYRCSG